MSLNWNSLPQEQVYLSINTPGLSGFVAVGARVAMIGRVWTAFVAACFTDNHADKFSAYAYGCQVAASECAGFDRSAFSQATPTFAK